MTATKSDKLPEQRKAPPVGDGRPKLMTVADVATHLGVNSHTAYRELQVEIPVIEIGKPGKRRVLRFDPIDVYVYAERLKRRPA